MIGKSRARLQTTCDFPSYHSKNYKQLTNNKEVIIVIRQTDGRTEPSPLLFIRRGLSCGRGIGTITKIPPPTAERQAAVGNQVGKNVTPVPQSTCAKILPIH